jgi:hypothetical protein
MSDADITHTGELALPDASWRPDEISLTAVPRFFLVALPLTPRTPDGPTPIGLTELSTAPEPRKAAKLPKAAMPTTAAKPPKGEAEDSREAT